MYLRAVWLEGLCGENRQGHPGGWGSAERRRELDEGAQALPRAGPGCRVHLQSPGGRPL